ALSFAASKRIGVLTHVDISQTDFLKRLKFIDYLCLSLEEFKGLIYGHIQHFGYIFLFILHIENLIFKPLAFTGFAGQMDICHELHFYRSDSLASTVFTASAVHIE